MADVTKLRRPGQPADEFFRELDEHNKTMRMALVRATEQFLNETLTYGVDSGVITPEQATELKRLATGPAVR